MVIDTSMLPRPTYRTTTGPGPNYSFDDMLSYNSSSWEVPQKSLDISDYSTDFLSDTRPLQGQIYVQVLKTSTRTKLDARFGMGLNTGDRSIFDKYIGFQASLYR